jgi:hypothetical protein
MKIFNLAFCILFVLFAALQYNDPDPYIWIPIYGYAAVLCWFAFKGKYYARAYIVGLMLYLAYALFLVFTKNGVIDWFTQHNAENLVQTMKAEKPWIEDTREFGGLVILIAVMLVDYWYAKKK